MLRKGFIPVNESKLNECVFVAKVIASSIETLLGNGKSLKCCESSGTSILTGSTPKILETIDIQHPAGFIINSACQSFQKEFGCGSTTLVCVIGYWAGALQDLADMGVPTAVIVSVLDEIMDQLENILQQSCISLRAIQNISVDDPMFHQNVPSQDLDPLKSIYHVSDEYVEYSKEICDESTNCIEDDSIDIVELLKTNVNENHVSLGTSQSFNKTDLLPRTERDSQLRQSSTYSASKDLSVDNLSSTLKETRKDVVEDEFDCCFDDGLTVSEETPRNFGWSFSASSRKPCNDNKNKTLAKKQPSSLFGEKSLGKSSLELNNGTLLNCASISRECELNSKQRNCNRYSWSHNLSTNNSELLNISSKMSIHRNSMDTVFASKMDVQNVLLRSRHLTCQTTTREPSTLSNSQDYNVKCGGAIAELPAHNRVLGSVCNKVGNSSSLVVSTDNYEQKINHEPRKDETESDFLGTCQRNEYWLNLLGSSLAHGKEKEMSLALDILKKQFAFLEKHRRKLFFQLDVISVQTVLGPPVRNSCVLEGAVVELSKENQCIIARDIDSPKRIALVRDDISYNNRHPGFKDSVQVTHTVNKEDFCRSILNAQSKWIERVMLVIKSLNLGVVAVHGQVTSVLRDNLHALGIIVLEQLSNHQLDVFSKMTGTSVVSYVLDLTAYDLGKPVTIRILDSGWSSGKHSAKSNAIQTFVFGQISLWCEEQLQKVNPILYSVVLCGQVQDLVDDSELKFWNCVHRLRNAIEDQCVLPGGGDTEIICVKHLEDIKDCRPPEKAPLFRRIEDDYNEFRPLIFDAICTGLKQFVARTNSNIFMTSPHQCSSILDRSGMETSQTIYDNYSCKVEEWKRAIRIVKLLLNSEYHISTGL